MYHAHFGLKRPLFDGGIAQDQSVFRSAKHDQLVERFKLALASPCSVITLTGPPGIGKTTLTSAALRASQTRMAMAWLNGLVTNGTELLELLLVELGLVAERTTRVERLQLWRQFHGEMGATESRVFVIAERADDLSVEVLRSLDGLTAPDATGYTGANLILLGQAGLERHLEAPALESLRQRIRLRARLEPFTEPELQDYLRHQAACAGGDYDHLFAPGTIAALFRHSGGVARLANHLCETAMTIAADEAQKLLTPEIVQRVATTILGLNTSSVRSAGAATTAAFAPTAPAAGVSFAPMSLTAASYVSAPTVPAAPTNPTPAAVATPTAPAIPVSATPAAALPAAKPPSLPAAAPAASTAATAAGATVTTIPPSPAPAVPEPAAPATRSPVAPAVLKPAPVAIAMASGPAESHGAQFEFDGEATEVPDVSIVDFPVLTDAVDDEPAPSAPRTIFPPAAPKPATPPLVATVARTAPAAATVTPTAVPAGPPPIAATAPASQPATATPPARPTPPVAAPATRRIETAYATPKPAAPIKPTTPPVAAPAKPPETKAAPPAPAPMASHDPEADDALRQTQTMRAISVAKSIDDISSSMAETLFGEADLDILSAALAASIDESGETEAPAPPPARPAVSAPQPRKAPVSTGDDLLDLLDLTSDATLELMDDSHDRPSSGGRKTANQR